LEAQRLEKERQAAIGAGDQDRAKEIQGQLISGFLDAQEQLRQSVGNSIAQGGFGLGIARSVFQGAQRVQDVRVQNLDPFVKFLRQNIILQNQFNDQQNQINGQLNRRPMFRR